MGELTYPATRDALDDVHYRDLQSLAADLGHGPIVGVSSEDLASFVEEKLFNADGQLRDEYVDETAEPVDETQEHETTDDVEETRPDGGTSTDAISVGHEGHEKLSPEGAPDDDSAAVPAPDGVDLDGYSMADLEADAHSDPTDVKDVDESPEPVDEDGKESSSLLDRIKGDKQRSSEEIVEDADTDEERQRREELKGRFEDAIANPSSSDDDVGEAPDQEAQEFVGAGKTHTPNGIVVDESLVGYLIDMPFNTAAAATGWDGWELSDSEREANAELFVAMCDEHDVDLSPTVMFALSMGGTLSGKALRYKRHRSQSDVSVEDVEEIDQEATSDDVEQSAPEQRRRQRPPLTGQARTGNDSDGFDFEDSSSWG